MYIVSTISIDIHKKLQIRNIVTSGGNVFRYNFAYGAPEQILKHILMVRNVSKELGMSVIIMADLPGGKVRIAGLSNDKLIVKQGQKVIISTNKKSSNYKNCIYVNDHRFFESLKKGTQITIADGEVALEVSNIVTSQTIETTCLNSGTIFPNKSLMSPTISSKLEEIGTDTLNYLNKMDRFKPDWIAISFATPKNIKQCKRALDIIKNDRWNPKIVAKIETENGAKNISEICKNADVVIVARGDLGLLCPIEELGILQKKIIKDTKANYKKVIVATQILDSSSRSYIPQRSEVLDLTNIVLDGADGIMLANETVSNMTPEIPVQLADRIIKYVNSHR